MIMCDYYYDGSTGSLRQVYELHPQGVIIRCPKCKSELVIALTCEEANQKKAHPGIYCPLAKKHVLTILELKK